MTCSLLMHEKVQRQEEALEGDCCVDWSENCCSGQSAIVDHEQEDLLATTMSEMPRWILEMLLCRASWGASSALSDIR